MQGSFTEIVIKDAIRMNMDEICITDHVDYGVKCDWDCGKEILYRNGDPFANVDYPRYVAAIRDRCSYIGRADVHRKISDKQFSL